MVVFNQTAYGGCGDLRLGKKAFKTDPQYALIDLKSEILWVV